jgi:hypothetical protein
MTVLSPITPDALRAAEAKAAQTNHTYSYAGLQDGSLATGDIWEQQKLTGASIADLTLAAREARLIELGGMAVRGTEAEHRSLPWWFDATKDPDNRTLWVAPSWKAESAFDAAGLLGWNAELVPAQLRWTYLTGDRKGKRTYRNVEDTYHIVIPDGVFGPEPIVTSADAVKKGFGLWQNEAILDMIKAIRDHEDSSLDSCGHYGLGKHAFAAVAVGDTRYIIPGLDDPGTLFLVFDNDFTGTKSSRIYWCFVRHFCRNTNLIGSSQAVAMVNIVHKGDMADKAGLAVNLLVEAIGGFDAWAGVQAKLAEVELTVAQVSDTIAPALYPYTGGQAGTQSTDPEKAGKKSASVVEDKRRRFVNRFAESETLTGIPRSAYRARQALLEAEEFDTEGPGRRTQTARLTKVTEAGQRTTVDRLAAFDALFTEQTGVKPKAKRAKATNVQTLY